MQQVNAIYDNGVFKPLGPVDLKEQEVVLLSIEKAVDEGQQTPEVGPTLFEILDEVGLVACVQGAPADLSANPGHLAGFGKSGS